MAALVKVKEGKNFVLYENDIILIKDVRFSYPHLDKPFAGKDPQPGAIPKFGIVGMLGNKTHQAAKTELEAIISRMLKAKKMTKMPGKDKFFRDGEEEKEEVYTGHWIVSAREERRPTVRNKRGELVIEERKIAELIQGGYWGHMLIRPWFQDNKHGQKINAGLVGVQHIRDDETFGEGSIDDTDAFQDESDGADDGGSGMDVDDDDI